MGRENKNEAIASGHRARILQAAEALFMEKSFPATTIADISAASGYSRRTLYAYYESKEEILRQIVKQGLEQLRQELQSAVEGSDGFERRSRAVFDVMLRYHRESPCSAQVVSSTPARQLMPPGESGLPNSAKEILALGEGITKYLMDFLKAGQAQGFFRLSIRPELTVPLWDNQAAGLAQLLQTKGAYYAKLGVSERELTDYAYEQFMLSLRRIKEPERGLHEL